MSDGDTNDTLDRNDSEGLDSEGLDVERKGLDFEEEERGVQWVEETRQMSMVAQGLEAVPEGLAEKYPGCRQIDLSENALSSLSGLEGFAELDSLVIDGNRITGEVALPQLPALRTFWANDNNVVELGPLLDRVAKSFPRLTYLSLLKNPCCPNYFVGKDQDDYKRYRLYVLHRLPLLKFLDSSPVSSDERREAERVGKYCGQVVRPSKVSSSRDDSEYQNIRGLPPTVRDTPTGKANFGISRYVYSGKMSEGNRYILNSDL